MKAVSKMNSGRSHLSRVRSGKETNRALTLDMRPTTYYPSKDAAFKQALIDAKYYPREFGWLDANYRSHREPKNLDEIHKRLQQQIEPSLSPFQFTNEDFLHFRSLHYSDTPSKAEVMSSILPIIQGREAIASGQDCFFGNLKPLAQNMSKAKPDYFNGSYSKEIHTKIQKDLGEYIMPSDNSRPLLPNFFFEQVFGRGEYLNAESKITEDLAYGARGMHKIQSYGQGQSVFDGNAYTIGLIYDWYDRAITCYSMHVTGPAGPNGEPNYWTNIICSFQMIDSVDNFREGVAALRNAQDWAKEQRDKFIALANERVTIDEGG